MEMFLHIHSVLNFSVNSFSEIERLSHCLRCTRYSPLFRMHRDTFNASEKISKADDV